VGATFCARTGASLRVRWALEEAGIAYEERLVGIVSQVEPVFAESPVVRAKLDAPAFAASMALARE
jgi:hypothetical protein